LDGTAVTAPSANRVWTAVGRMRRFPAFMIYRIAEPDHWREALRKGEFRSPDLLGEGFIHFSELHQVRNTADRYYKGRGDMLLLKVDDAALSVPVVRENTRGGQELFPHVYGPVPLSAVLEVVELPMGPDGRLVFGEP
jgi:uncharacterized protein (DUF952 family)